MRVLVDSDGLVYSIGFANQSADYRVSILAGDRLLDVQVVSGLDEVKALDSQLDEGEHLEVEPLITPAPLEHALGGMKRSLLAIEERLRGMGMKFTKLEPYLTGSGNFRDDIARIRPYKGNREKVSRPVHYDALRAYLETRWGATVVEGIEADDAVAMVAAAHEYAGVCIVSPDKDLRQVPGPLYNPRTEELTVISPSAARCFFYRQMLAGDSVDNVLGAYKCGTKRAESLVTGSQSEVESAQAVLDEFRESVERRGCPYAKTHRPEEAMLETGRLLHLLRSPDDKWNIPKEVR